MGAEAFVLPEVATKCSQNATGSCVPCIIMASAAALHGFTFAWYSCPGSTDLQRWAPGWCYLSPLLSAALGPRACISVASVSVSAACLVGALVAEHGGSKHFLLAEDLAHFGAIGCLAPAALSILQSAPADC